MHKKVRMLSYKWIHPIVPYLTIAIYLAYVHDPALYFDIFSCSLGFSRFLSMMLFGKDVHTTYMKLLASDEKQDKNKGSELFVSQ